MILKFLKDLQRSSDRVHTNFVEGTNPGLKRMIPVRSRVKDGIEGRMLNLFVEENIKMRISGMLLY
jgi:hypothetical protein